MKLTQEWVTQEKKEEKSLIKRHRHQMCINQTCAALFWNKYVRSSLLGFWAFYCRMYLTIAFLLKKQKDGCQSTNFLLIKTMDNYTDLMDSHKLNCYLKAEDYSVSTKCVHICFNYYKIQIR